MSSQRKDKTAQDHDLAAGKKATVLGRRQRQGGMPKVAQYAMVAVIVAAAVAMGYRWSSSPDTGQSPQSLAAVAQAADQAGDEVFHPAADFADGKARFYSMKIPDGLTVRYFIIKSADGVIRAAFDACDVCWRSNKGYSQDGDYMVCNNCGRRFASAQVNEVKGGCNPSPLNRRLEGDRVKIKVADILEGRRYFNFKS